MINKETYSELYNCLACYLNQDFIEIDGGPDEALMAFKKATDAETHSKVKNQICLLLNLNLTEKEMEDILLGQFGCHYDYLSEWETARLWLKHVLELLS